MTSAMCENNIHANTTFVKKYKKFGDICLTKDNISVYVCSACQGDFGTVQTFWLHIQKYHTFENTGSVNDIKINCPPQEPVVNEAKLADFCLAGSSFDPRRMNNGYPDLTQPLFGNYHTPQLANANDAFSYVLQNGQVHLTNDKINTGLEKTIKLEVGSGHQSQQQSYQQMLPNSQIAAASSDVKNTKATCFECGITFTTNTQLYRHNGYRHRRAKVCTICSAAFSSDASLRIHMRLHDDSRKFVCPKCGKKFNRNTSLRNHVLVHEDERPFACTECKQSFKLKLYLSRHKKRVHKIFE